MHRSRKKNASAPHRSARIGRRLQGRRSHAADHGVQVAPVLVQSLLLGSGRRPAPGCRPRAAGRARPTAVSAPRPTSAASSGCRCSGTSRRSARTSRRRSSRSRHWTRSWPCSSGRIRPRPRRCAASARNCSSAPAAASTRSSRSPAPTPATARARWPRTSRSALAKSDKRVVLVDCDFRKPRVHRMFALPNAGTRAGLGRRGPGRPRGVVQGCEIENLSLLPCGPRPANPAELLTTPKFQEILDDLRANYDFVIIDTPPVLAVSDPAAVAPRADGVILVFRMTKDARPAAERAKDDLTAVGGQDPRRGRQRLDRARDGLRLRPRLSLRIPVLRFVRGPVKQETRRIALEARPICR